MEVLPAVFTSITTTIVAFMPVLLIKQEHMNMMHDMAFVVIFSLAFSLVEAFFILPAHLSSPKLARKEKKKSGLRTKFNKIIDYKFCYSN